MILKDQKDKVEAERKEKITTQDELEMLKQTINDMPKLATPTNRSRQDLQAIVDVAHRGGRRGSISHDFQALSPVPAPSLCDAEVIPPSLDARTNRSLVSPKAIKGPSSQAEKIIKSDMVLAIANSCMVSPWANEGTFFQSMAAAIPVIDVDLITAGTPTTEAKIGPPRQTDENKEKDGDDGMVRPKVAREANPLPLDWKPP